MYLKIIIAYCLFANLSPNVSSIHPPCWITNYYDNKVLMSVKMQKLYSSRLHSLSK